MLRSRPSRPGISPLNGKIFAMFVMGAMADAVAYIVEKRAGFELNAGLRRKMMDRLEVIKKHDAEFANVFSVLLIVIEAAAESASGGEHLASFGVVAMGLLARKGFAGDFMEKTFANANAGNNEATNVEIAAEDGKDDGGDAHDVGAIAANSIGFHAGAKIALQNIGKRSRSKRQFERGQAVLARAGGDGGESFGIAAESDADFVR